MKDRQATLPDNAAIAGLGFKCGLEIHQQLKTRKKLFCHCPVGLTDERHDAEILRHMRPTLSELGEYDGTALMEFKTRKEVVYRLYRDRTCTYEMDDTPPFLVNQEAIDIAIKISLLFNCKIVDELHVIRKQYLDGSIPTGFQRTMIVGIDGQVPFRGRTIKISQVNLEEESCREVTDIGHTIVFATDRLSIPLVEIITAADMQSPEEAAAVCRMLGNAMKDSRLVRRGIGTVRQDVNVSIDGGSRVEIKGVHKVGNIEPLTAVEAMRQKALLQLQRLFLERFKSPDRVDFKEENITWLFNGTVNVISRRLESDVPHKVMALYLPRLVDIVNYTLQPGHDFGFELSGRVRVIACIDARPNLFFYSQREKYDIPEKLWDRLVHEFGASVKDDIAMVAGPSADVVTAVNEIKIRIGELAMGVINETRQDLKDGTTDFERILPGPDRMYPDTDHPPVKITADRVAFCRRKLGEPLWEKQARWRRLPLSESLVQALSLSPFQSIFEKLIEDKEIKPAPAAHICAELTVGLRRSGYDLTGVSSAVLYDLIHTALRRHWPYRRLKSDLIKVADGAEWTEGPHFELTDEDFDTIWKQACASFDCRADNTSRDKMRRYVTGKILSKFTNTARVLEKIDARMAAL